MRKKYLLPVFLFFIISCDNESVTKQPAIQKSMITDSLLKANKFLTERDSELIRSYVNRHKLEMQVSREGLWYNIYKKTDKQKVKNGDIVRYDYRLELLDGTLCYTSDSTGTAQIKIGSSGKETGLEKGLLMMRAGEKAKFILPPHLAYGLIGDMKKIPARSALVYDVEIKEIVDF